MKKDKEAKKKKKEKSVQVSVPETVKTVSPETEDAILETLLQHIGGKWKILIVWYISVYKVQRFGELQRRIGNEITKSTLTKQLRELENDGWINRQIYQEIPPRVEYTLTELSESFIPILEQMKEWSETHLS